MPMILVKAFALLGLGLLSNSVLSAQENGWINMFDQKTLNGWKANENPESWSAKDGTIVGDGERSHLFWMDRECKNCEFKADVHNKKVVDFVDEKNTFTSGYLVLQQHNQGSVVTSSYIHKQEPQLRLLSAAPNITAPGHVRYRRR